MKLLSNKIVIGILGLLLGLLFSFSHEALGQSTQTLSECDDYVNRDQALIFNCEAGGKVRIRPVSNNVVEVWASADGSLSRNNKSFAVIRDTLGSVPVLDVEEAGDQWIISSGNIQLSVQMSPFSLEYLDDHGRTLGGDSRANAYGWDGRRWTWNRRIRPDEEIVGLGEKAGSIVRNGGTYTMWNSDHPCYGPDTDPLYKSIPFYMSSRHYGVFLDNTYKTRFDVGKTDTERLSVTADGGPLIYYVIRGDGYKDIIDQYTQLTGRPMLPPQWAFGYAQSRGFYTNEELTRSAARTFRAHRIPADIIYQDIGWVDKLQNFDWEPGRYEHPADMLDDLQQQGFKVIVSQDPIISTSNKKQWDEAADKDLLVLDERSGKPYEMPWPWGGPGGLVDFTNPDAADYWGKLQQKVVDQGVDGFWTDMGEPAWSNLDAPDRLNMEHQKGMHAEIHNVYGHTWDEVVTNQWRKRNGNRRIFQMTRAAYAGMQRFTFGWSGDSGCGDDILDGWKNLADQVRIGQSAGMGGLVFWSSDISGYCGDIDDYAAFAPIYVRWMQFGMFNSLSRVHHNGNWAVEPWQFGPDIEDMVRDAVELRYSLFPYIYTYARRSYDTGLPMMRALALEYPDNPEVLKVDTQFMFGKEMLVAPVVSDTTIRKLYLPKGQWVDFNHPSRIEEGGQWITQNAPLDETPIWVKAGSIIPTMPVMQYIHENPDYPVILDVYPHPEAGQTADFELYEDDGLTYDYENSQGSRTGFRVETTGKGWTVEVEAREADGYNPPSPRNLVFKIHLPEDHGDLNVFQVKDGASSEMNKRELTKVLDFEGPYLGWSKEPAREILYIKTRDTGKRQVFRIVSK